LYALEGADGPEIRDLLAAERPYARTDIDRVIELVIEGGYVDQVIDEATERLRIAEKASARIPDGKLTPVLRSLDSYLLDRVEQARG
jgi:geranylgeranyl pyrophosphate synthase